LASGKSNKKSAGMLKDKYSMPEKIILSELETFDAFLEKVFPEGLNSSNYLKYRRGWLLRAELDFRTRNTLSLTGTHVGMVN